jgi:hypothetical protein
MSDKMKEYVESLFNVFTMINENDSIRKDRRFQIITLVIFNYVRKMAKDNDIILNTIEIKKPINLMPIFEYISRNNIELYDFNNIELSDVDVNKKEDLERYVLTHIYYITQKAKNNPDTMK